MICIDTTLLIIILAPIVIGAWFCLKAWKYLDEALEFSSKAGLKLDEAEIIRTNSTGLALYNPENAAAMLESMKNKNISRADKIAARIKYEKQQQSTH